MTDKQIPIDEQMENLNNLATQQLKRIEEEKRQIEHIAKTHLVETFDMQREIDKLKKELQAKEQECERLKDLANNALEKVNNYLDKKEKSLLYKQALTEIKEIARVNSINTCWTAINLCADCDEIEECGLQSPFEKLKAIVQIISECEGNND